MFKKWYTKAVIKSIYTLYELISLLEYNKKYKWLKNL